MCPMLGRPFVVTFEKVIRCSQFYQVLVLNFLYLERGHLNRGVILELFISLPKQAYLCANCLSRTKLSFLLAISKGASARHGDIKLLPRLRIEVTDEADSLPLFETGYQAARLVAKIVFR